MKSFISIMCAGFVFLCAARASETMLFDFESPKQAFENAEKLAYVPEHATQGKTAGKIKLDAPFSPNIFFFGGTNQVGKWGEYDQFVMDVFVEGGGVTAAGFVCDKPNQGWDQRHNYEYKLQSGARQLKFSLGALTRENGKGPLDLKALVMIALSFRSDDPKTPATIYLDNARLVKGVAGEVSVAGMKKFDFGPANSALMPGFLKITKDTAYDKNAGFGWKVGGQFANDFDMNQMLGRHRAPDDLCRDFCQPLRATLLVDVPDGAYSVWLMLGPPANGFGPYFMHRSVAANGKTVVDQSFDAKSFKEYEYKFQDEEDLPGDDLWEKYINKLFVAQRFNVDVSGGQLQLDINAYGSPWTSMVNGLVLWPKSSDKDAEQWLAKFNATRKEQFQSLHVEKIPSPAAPYSASEQEKARGFVSFVHSPDRDIQANSVPSANEVKNQTLALAGSPGETVDGCLGILPLKDCGSVTAATCSLKNGAQTISARVLALRYKSLNRTAVYEITPKFLDEVSANPLPLRAGVTRSFWVSVSIPADAPPGEYSGELKLSGAALKEFSAPVHLKVWPIKLAEPEIPMGMFLMGPVDAHLAFEPNRDAYWAAWKNILEDARAHGLTSVDPGLSIPLTKIANGKAEIDFREADQFMELARAAGYSKELNGYAIHTGLRTRVSTEDYYDAEAKRWGVANYGDAVKAYFNTIREHAKEKNWLPIAFCTDDEYVVHPGGNMARLAAHHRVLQENAPGFHFVAFDSVIRDANHSADPAAMEKMLADIDTWGAGLHDKLDAELVQKAKHRLWLYNTGMNRFSFGTYMFFAHQKFGVSGFFQWTYNGGGTYGNFYLASHNEAHYGVTYPSTRGLRPTPVWERIRSGCNDHRYLETATQLIAKAAAANKGATEAAALKNTLESTFAKLRFGKPEADAIDGEGKADNPMTPEGMEAFRCKVADEIVKLQDALK
jgi:hypothetical protein